MNINPIVWIRDKFDSDKQDQFSATLNSKSLQQAIDKAGIGDNWEIFMSEDFPQPFMSNPSTEDIAYIGKACVTYGYAFIYYFLYVALPEKANVEEFENTFVGEFKNVQDFIQQFQAIVKDFDPNNYYWVGRNDKVYIFDLRRKNRY